MDNINVEKEILNTVFDLSTPYYVDFYQRSYKWGTDTVEILLRDIIEKFKKEHKKSSTEGKSVVQRVKNYSWYYLNTYVTHTLNEKGEEKIYIVDGQQRLTTLTLVLFELYKKVRDLFNKEDQAYDGLVVKIRNRILIDGEGGPYKLIHEGSGDIMDKLFEGKSIDEYKNDENITIRTIAQNYKVVSSSLKEIGKEDIECFVEYFLRKIVLVRLEVQTKEAPMLFEAINDRGEPLKPHEILKAKLLGQIIPREGEDFKEAHMIWEEQKKKLFSLNNNHNELDDFFSLFLRARYVPNRQDPLVTGLKGNKFINIYHKRFIDGCKDRDLKKRTEILNFIKEDYKFYTDLYIKIKQRTSEQSPPLYYNSFHNIQENKEYLSILSACKINDPEEEKKIEWVSFEVDRLISLLKLQGKYGNGNRCNDMLYKASAEIRDKSADGIPAVYDKYLIKELNRGRGDNDDTPQVTDPLVYKLFKDSGRELGEVVKYFLARVDTFLGREAALPTSSLADFYKPKKDSKDSYDVEHILAYTDNNENQNKFGKDDDEDHFEKQRNRLGALLLIKGGDNSSSSNEPYQEKLRTYASSSTLYAQTLTEDFYKSNTGFRDLMKKFNLDFKAIDNYDEAAINYRQKILFEIAKIIWVKQRPSI